MFLIVPPSPPLTPFVRGYWFVEDLAGSYQGRPIRTSPHPAAVLTVHLGQPNMNDRGIAVPVASLLGLQTRVRTWLSGPETKFVMVMLSVEGLIRLFPATGDATADSVLDLGGVLGDRGRRGLVQDLTAAWQPHLVAKQLDHWLERHLHGTRTRPEARRFAAAWKVLESTGRVDATATQVGISRRELHRWSRRHLGVAPKQLADLARLQASVASVQTGQGDPVAGFSDQAHQIRTWGRRLGVTPGAYTPSLLATMAKQAGAMLPQQAVTHYL